MLYFLDRQGIPKCLFENLNRNLSIHDFISIDIKNGFLNSGEVSFNALRSETERKEFNSILVKSVSQARAAFELCKVRGFIRAIQNSATSKRNKTSLRVLIAMESKFVCMLEQAPS